MVCIILSSGVRRMEFSGGPFDDHCVPVPERPRVRRICIHGEVQPVQDPDFTQADEPVRDSDLPLVARSAGTLQAMRRKALVVNDSVAVILNKA